MVLSDSTNEKDGKEKMRYEKGIRDSKSLIAGYEDQIIRQEHELGGRGEFIT